MVYCLFERSELVDEIIWTIWDVICSNYEKEFKGREGFLFCKKENTSRKW